MSGIITIPAVFLMLTITTVDNKVDQALAVIESQEKCAYIRTIIVDDFKKLREAEAKIKPSEIKPRSHLLAIQCFSADIPVSGQKTNLLIYNNKVK